MPVLSGDWPPECHLAVSFLMASPCLHRLAPLFLIRVAWTYGPPRAEELVRRMNHASINRKAEQ